MAQKPQTKATASKTKHTNGNIIHKLNYKDDPPQNVATMS